MARIHEIFFEVLSHITSQSWYFPSKAAELLPAVCWDYAAFGGDPLMQHL